MPSKCWHRRTKPCLSCLMITSPYRFWLIFSHYTFLPQAPRICPDRSSGEWGGLGYKGSVEIRWRGMRFPSHLQTTPRSPTSYQLRAFPDHLRRGSEIIPLRRGSEIIIIILHPSSLPLRVPFSPLCFPPLILPRPLYSPSKSVAAVSWPNNEGAKKNACPSTGPERCGITLKEKGGLIGIEIQQAWSPRFPQLIVPLQSLA